MRIVSALLCATIALLIASCTSPIVKRIERNPEIYNALSEHHKELVQRGAVVEGMTKKAVFLAWGQPDHAAQGSRNGKQYEKWSYAGYDPVYTSGFGFGGGYWGGYNRNCFYDRGFIYEPMMTYVPYEEARVEFLNGIVFAWSRSR